MSDRGSLVNRSKQRQELRLSIRGEKLLKEIIEHADALADMGNEAKTPLCSAPRVGALRSAADIKLRLLDKILPSLQSVEHDLGESTLSMQDTELHARIHTLMQRLAERGILDGGLPRIGAAALRGGETIQ